MKKILVKALLVVSIVNMFVTTPALAAMPLEMSSERGNGDSWTITLKNVSGEDKADVSVRACFYDADGRLKKVKNYGESDIRSGESTQTEMALPSMDFVYADAVKVIVWQGVEPQAEVIYLKGDKHDSVDALVKYANENGLVTGKFENEELTEELTRDELCSLIVSLYEKVTGSKIKISQSSYEDTKDEEVLKAVSLGVISGYSDGSFGPDEPLTNVSAAIVLYRTMQKLDLEIPDNYSDVEEFDDFKKNSGHWAESYVYRLKEIGVFDGVFINTFGSEENISKKEAIALIANCYNIAK